MVHSVVSRGRRNRVDALSTSPSHGRAARAKLARPSKGHRGSAAPSCDEDSSTARLAADYSWLWWVPVGTHGHRVRAAVAPGGDDLLDVVLVDTLR
jgi:hypothetical protein